MKKIQFLLFVLPAIASMAQSNNVNQQFFLQLANPPATQSNVFASNKIGENIFNNTFDNQQAYQIENNQVLVSQNRDNMVEFTQVNSSKGLDGNQRRTGPGFSFDFSSRSGSRKLNKTGNHHNWTKRLFKMEKKIKKQFSRKVKRSFKTDLCFNWS